MAYPFVPGIAYGKRAGPVKAFVIHLAEGGGTVGYLRNDATPPPRGVSVHYVVEYTGRIVQMVQESQASGSINPSDIRTSDDADGFFGATAAKAVMGSWWKNPNAAAITVEVEGFAKSGPNAQQHGSLKTLIADVRSRYPGMGLLGHRDFADYKACPGKLVHWNELGGHGPAKPQGDTDMPGLTVTNIKAASGTVTVKAIQGVQAVQVDDPKQRFGMAPGSIKETFAIGTLVGDPLGKDTATEDRHTVRLIGAELAVLLDSQVSFEAAIVPLPNCDSAVNAALDHLTAPLSALVTAVQEARP